MTEDVLLVCAFLTLVVTGAAAFIAVITGTIVYSWWRRLQVARDEELPELLIKAIDKQLARYQLPLREVVDDTGKSLTKPAREAAPVIGLEDYNEWKVLD